MPAPDALAFVRRHHRAVLVTRKSDGGLQTSPVTVGAGDHGKIVISSRETAYKVRNIRRDPNVTLCVFTDRFFGEWIQVDGTAGLLTLPDAMEPLVDYYRNISGEHPDWDDYRATMERDRRLLIRIDVARTGPTRSG